MKKVLFVLLISIRVFAFQGGEVGNGGDAVVCFLNEDTKSLVHQVLIDNKNSNSPRHIFDEMSVRRQIDTVQMFDLYEYTQLAGFPLKTYDAYSSNFLFTEIVDELLNRLSKKSTFSHYLNKAFRRIPYRYWKPTKGIVAINDEGMPYHLESKCLLVQLAVQYKGIVHYDEYLFSKLSEISKATLVLHEIVYNVGINYGHETSEVVRKITGLLISGSEWETLSPHYLNITFADFLEKGEFELAGKYQAGTDSLWLTSFSSKTGPGVQFFETGEIKAGILAQQHIIDNDGTQLLLEVGDLINFSLDGQIIPNN